MGEHETAARLLEATAVDVDLLRLRVHGGDGYLLHVGLRHGARRRGRDPFLWNVACDYVINGWLLEMGLGELPDFGGLHDPALKGLSAEAVYDRIVTDLRRYRKVATLRGAGLGDLLTGGRGE